MKFVQNLIFASIGATLGLTLEVSSALAAPFGFGVDTNSSLYSIDLGSGNATLIGNTGVFLEGIAIDQSGNLFGTDIGGELYSLDSSNGSSALIGGTGLGNIEALDFLGNTLLGVDFNSTPTVYAINVTDASVTTVTTSATTIGAVRSGTVLDNNTLLVRSDEDGFGNSGNFLHTFDLTTGATSLIGNLTNITAALDFASDGNLYGLRDNGEVVVIDPSNASETVIGNTGNQFWLGLAATSQPSVTVPEPSSALSLLVLGSLGGGFVLKRKRPASTNN
ncbi:hypothetical protein NIES4103_01390 [Nostoc sp. NIES-4103]|nr:hypothetical protein NIES4103_01390 [Nostoc sp. NIES-4103]